MSGERWKEVSKASPCPACGKDHYCAFSPNGKVLRCMGSGDTPAGMVNGGADRDGGTLYRTTTQPTGTSSRKQNSRKAGIPATAKVDLAAMLKAMHGCITEAQVTELAAGLCVTVESLRTIGIGWATAEDLRKLRAGGAGWAENPPDGAFAFPERGGNGQLVGFSFRETDGHKGSPSRSVGARRGLIVSATMHDSSAPVLLVEGASDVAALISVGLPAVGRPSNTAGADDLAQLLNGRDVLVVGERDGKPDGRWPGRDGAVSISKRLAAAWNSPVKWTLPPEGRKDIREWLAGRVAAGLDLADAEACHTAGRELLMAMQAETQEVKPQKSSTSEALVRLALERFRLGRTEADEPFAVERDGPNIAIMFRGSKDALRSTLAREYRRRFGRVPNAAAIVDALAVLQGEAMEAEPEAVHLRVAELEDGVAIDLGDAEGQAVVVKPGGWEVVASSPLLFRRTALTGRLPKPEKGGSLAELRKMLNVTDDTWPLVCAWLVAALLPEIAHPILMLGGQQGTGKTTAAKRLVDLIDPSPAPLRSDPHNSEAWAVAAAGAWVVCIDNVSKISSWWSDALCKAVTGDGMVRRRLYSDQELTVLSFRRVIVLTSIDAGALRGDLGDRLLLVDLERIDGAHRRADTDLDREYSQARARLFGAILDALAGVLTRLPSISLASLPRMADFARVLAALDEADGSGGRALRFYLGQRDRIASNVLDADLVGSAVLGFLEHQGYWQGTTGELLKRLTPDKPPRGWPNTPSAMGARLARLLPSLQAAGIKAEYDRVGHDRTRQYTFQKSAGNAVRNVRNSSVPSENVAAACGQQANECGQDDETGCPRTEVHDDESDQCADSADSADGISPVSSRRPASLDPDTPGPVDLLTAEQRKRYMAFYHSRSESISPNEKHSRAWHAALTYPIQNQDVPTERKP